MIDSSSGIGPVTAIRGDQPVAQELSREPSPKPEDKDLAPAAAQAVEAMMKSLDPPLMGRNERLSILRDETTGTFIYQSVDKDTGKLLRQWPAEFMVQFKAHLRETQGVMFDTEI